MLKGSGLTRAYPRLNARTRQAEATESIQNLHTTQPIFRPLWKIASILCLSFGAVIAVLLFGLNLALPENTDDVFAPYQTVYPGLALADLGSQDCVLYIVSPYTHEEECDLRLSQSDDGPFRKVAITIHDGHVGEIRFQCSDLYVGNIVDRWGRPDEITRLPRGYMLRWSQKGVTAIARGSQWFNYQLPVETVIHI